MCAFMTSSTCPIMFLELQNSLKSVNSNNYYHPQFTFLTWSMIAGRQTYAASDEKFCQSAVNNAKRIFFHFCFCISMFYVMKRVISCVSVVLRLCEGLLKKKWKRQLVECLFYQNRKRALQQKFGKMDFALFFPARQNLVWLICALKFLK